MIPAQLRRDDLLFVLVPAGEKGPKYSGWNVVENGYRYDDSRLLVLTSSSWISMMLKSSPVTEGMHWWRGHSSILHGRT